MMNVYDDYDDMEEGRRKEKEKEKYVYGRRRMEDAIVIVLWTTDYHTIHAPNPWCMVRISSQLKAVSLYQLLFLRILLLLLL